MLNQKDEWQKNIVFLFKFVRLLCNKLPMKDIRNNNVQFYHIVHKHIVNPENDAYIVTIMDNNLLK